MPSEHPDLKHARNWLDEIRTDLFRARDLLSTPLGTIARVLDGHAATLGDIIARGEIIPQASLIEQREVARKIVADYEFDRGQYGESGAVDDDDAYHLAELVLADERQSKDPESLPDADDPVRTELRVADVEKLRLLLNGVRALDEESADRIDTALLRAMIGTDTDERESDNG